MLGEEISGTYKKRAEQGRMLRDTKNDSGHCPASPIPSPKPFLTHFARLRDILPLTPPSTPHNAPPPSPLTLPKTILSFFLMLKVSLSVLGRTPES